MMKIRVVIIVLKSGSAWDPADPGLEPSRVEEKTREGKTRCDPTDPADPTRPGCKPVDFCFFLFFLLKRRRFDFKKKLTRPTRSKLGTRVLDRTGSSNYGCYSNPNMQKMRVVVMGQIYESLGCYNNINNRNSRLLR
jgi:hypothetical protein